mmetsp:Transcript_99077/g.284856  ORF Transcript_99077/g.284856 Transcript_99077/m.284856 type:complete len:551 (-) Transcript_99077:448-2100(-)
MSVHQPTRAQTHAMSAAARVAGALLLGGLCLSDAGEVQAEDPGWELQVTSAGPEVPRVCFDAKGLPAFLNGAFFISGPALFERGSHSFQSFFDGFGRVNRFELRDRQVCYTSKWLGTGAMKAASASGDLGRGMFFMETTPPRQDCPLTDPMCDTGAPNDNNWVNMITMGSDAVILSDTYRMLDIDLETLSIKGVRPWADDKNGSTPSANQPDWISAMHIPLVGSAHPLLRPGSHTVVDVVVEAPMAMDSLLHSFVDVYTFEDNVDQPQKRNRIASIKAEKNQYFHSFGVTPNYIILPFNIEMDLPSVIVKPAQLLGCFHPSWKGVHIMDYTGAIVGVFDDMQPFYHTHIINSFENGTGVTLDVGVYDAVPFEKSPALVTSLFLDKTARDSEPNRCTVRRLHFHMSGASKGTTTVEDFQNQGRALDFFKVNMARSGLPYCIYYAVEWWHDGVSYANMAILKHDMCKGTRTYWKRPNTYPGEPFFVSGGADAEDDGVVLVSALDGAAGHNIFVVLDARTMEELQVVELPEHIPFTAHGQFVPDKRVTESIMV